MKACVKVIACMVFVILAAFACIQSSPPPGPSNPTPAIGPIGFPPQNFVLVESDLSSVKGLHQFDLAFHARTGQICKTWKWKLEGDTALNSIPECFQIVLELEKRLQEGIKEIRASNPIELE